MTTKATILRYTGGAVAVAGLAFSASFLRGRPTADPLVSWFISPLTIWTRLLGIVIGLVVIGIGLAIIGRSGTDE